MAPCLPPPLDEAGLAAAMREAVATTTGPARLATLAAMECEISLMLRRQPPGSEAATLLRQARAALREARATRH